MVQYIKLHNGKLYQLDRALSKYFKGTNGKLYPANQVHQITWLENGVWKSNLITPLPLPPYKVITIPKKNGTLRTVYSLNDENAAKQKAELKALKLRHKPISHYVKKHVGAITLISMDIKNAFESVTLKNANRYISLNNVAKLSFNAEGILMQGTPMASCIFHTMMSDIDKMIKHTLRKHYARYDIQYTRYVDDISISSKEKLNAFIINNLIEIVRNELSKRSFTLNERKTRISVDGQKSHKVLNVDLSQGRTGVRDKKKQAILWFKKGETKKALGMLAYLKPFLGYETYYRLKQKFESV